MFEPMIVLVTCGSEEEATTIARSLVEGRLAACVNLVAPVRSIYRWEGTLCDDKEWLLLVKTRKEKFSEVEQTVKSLHSYTVPEIVGVSIREGSSSYLDWLLEMTQ